MNRINNKIDTDQLLNKIQNNKSTLDSRRINVVDKPKFTDVLSRIQDKENIKFSKHAIERLSSRNIELSDNDLERINEGVGKAKVKGVREALILMDNKVFVASVRNNTIITAAVDEQLKENVFTNIDGAVIV